MPTYKRCPKSVDMVAQAILEKFSTHEPLLAARPKVDYLFAFADIDEKTGKLKGPAIVHHGTAALAVARKLPPKQRAAGRGDAEILIDGDWWEAATPEHREALLDHELHHLVATGDVDDMRRPILKIRPHDFEVGWFHLIAARHGLASQERLQARQLFDAVGQLYFPEIVGTQPAGVSISGTGRFGKLEYIKNPAQPLAPSKK